MGKANFDTSALDEGNPETRKCLQGKFQKHLLQQVDAGLREIPYSPVSDGFGGFSAAASMFDQYKYDPPVPKRLVAFGDQLATTPTGCVLAARDLSPTNHDRLLQICSPTLPELRDVQVMLVGAGFSLDDPIPTATAQGLEGLLRDFFARIGACVNLYGPVALTAGTGPKNCERP